MPLTFDLSAAAREDRYGLIGVLLHDTELDRLELLVLKEWGCGEAAGRRVSEGLSDGSAAILTGSARGVAVVATGSAAGDVRACPVFGNTSQSEELMRAGEARRGVYAGGLLVRDECSVRVALNRAFGDGVLNKERATDRNSDTMDEMLRKMGMDADLAHAPNGDVVGNLMVQNRVRSATIGSLSRLQALSGLEYLASLYKSSLENSEGGVDSIERLLSLAATRLVVCMSA